MRNPLIFLFLLLIFPLQAQESLSPQVAFPQNAGATPKVEAFERLEYAFLLPEAIQNRVNGYLNGEEGINPYDPEQVNITAWFTQPDGQKMYRYGFYYQEVENNGEAFKVKATPMPYRVRFAPQTEGQWKVQIEVVVNGERRFKSQQLAFECVASDNKGFLTRGYDRSYSDRYLRYSKTGETFFAIGENMNWPEDQFGPKSRLDYEKWVPELHNAGGNFFRVGMTPWSFLIEWEKLNNYHPRQNRMMELDHIFQLAEERDMFIMLHMLIHDPFLPPYWKGDPNSWESNPYNKEMEGVDEPLQFFEDSAAKATYKKQLRYIVARWGYSKALGIYEMVSEVDYAVKGYNKMGRATLIGNEWFREMSDFIRAQHPERLITGSFSVGEGSNAPRKIWPIVDVMVGHQYGKHESYNYKGRYDLARYLQSRYKMRNYPYILGEMGGGLGTIDMCSDITFHNALWATSMSGGFGTGMNWWWDKAIHKMGYQSNFFAIHQFFEGEDLVNWDYYSDQWRDNKVENFMLIEQGKSKVRGWVHNRSYWWPNMYATNDCIKRIIDDNNGTAYDPGDNQPYGEMRDDDKTTPVTGHYMIVKGLSPNMSYNVTFYKTRGKGGALNGAERTEKANMFGWLKVPLPDLDDANPDLAYKIERVE